MKLRRMLALAVVALPVWAQGPYLVKDINPAIVNTDDGNPTELEAMGKALFFRACDDQGCELWKSDGTAAGTALVRDIWPGSGSSRPSELTDVNGTLFFLANDGTHGIELWKSDGTAAGTVMVKDVDPLPATPRPRP